MSYREPNYGLVFFVSGVASGVMYAVWALIGLELVPGQEVEMKYADLIVILLTAVLVILTTLAVFIGALAVWGYSQFQKMTQEASAAHLEEMLASGKFREEIESLIVTYISSQLEDGKLRALLVERIDQMLLEDAAKRETQQPQPQGESAGEPFQG